MNRWALLACALAFAPPAAAQDRADKTRLDEFALPRDNADPRIEQLESPADFFSPGTSEVGDRDVTVPGPPTQPRAPVVQLSAPDGGANPSQLSDLGQSRRLASGSVSSPRDSRPQAALSLDGEDRCDPQADAERLAECQRILELRAAEFSAAEPPKLSAEQALLAEQGEATEVLAQSSSRLRLQLVSGEDPDADATSNQELAAIYLADNRPDASNGNNREDDVPDDASLAEAVESIQSGLPGSVSP